MDTDDELREGIRERYEELCRDLNLDPSTKTEAFDTYVKISENYTLEGDQLHWLVCALYVACRRTIVPSVGGADIEGNCVSLTRLIRSAKLSLLNFFSMIKKWSDMANLPKEFRDKIERLERNFSVSTVIFKKFTPIFKAIFKDPANDPPRQQRSRKQRPRQCLPSEVYQLTWKVFVQVKGHFPAISDDLVNSYHLLLCVIDWIYGNAVVARRDDLLNPEFEGVQHPPSVGEAPCIVELLCDRHEGLVVEAMTIKEHYFRQHISRLFQRKVLKGSKSDDLWGVLDLGSFEDNCKSVDKSYEEYVLTVGDFDERIFLDKDADEEIGTPAKGSTSADICRTPGRVGGAALPLPTQKASMLQQHIEKTRSLAPSTPLTGRRYLPAQEPHVTPVSTATKGVGKLYALLGGRKNGPSTVLVELFSECGRNPMTTIEERVRQMGEVFCQCYAKPTDDQPALHMDFARKRLQHGECLYYKMLESIMLREKRQLGAGNHKTVDLSALLEQDVFHRSLFACCLEVVIFSYNSQRTFPWITEVLEIPAYQFYKVIELIIRSEDGFSRDVVKHLNSVEESILDSLAWKSDSPLWDAIAELKDQKQTVPMCEEVCLPATVPPTLSASTEEPRAVPTHQLLSPLAHPVVRRLAQSDGKIVIRRDAGAGLASPLSPVRPLATDRFSSPVAGTAKRRLFGPNPGGQISAGDGSSSSSEFTVSVMPQQHNAGPFVQRIITYQQAHTEDGRHILIPVNLMQSIAASSANAADQGRAASGTASPAPVTSSSSSTTPSAADSVRPASDAQRRRKAGSLVLFFRKVYHLANVRLHDLCERLEIDDVLRKKIWTCFEHCLVHDTELMMDRHLDQFIVCAIYVMSKVVQKEVSFQDIMKCYRLQPQAQSHVYRSVLLETRKRRHSANSESSKNGSASRPSSPGSAEKDEKRRLEQLSTIRSSSTMPVPQPTSQPPTPTKVTGAASTCFQFEDGSQRGAEERGDLIRFYNQVYVKCIKDFVSKFSPENCNVPPTSALPTPRPAPLSPRQVSRNHSVFVMPQSSTDLLTPTSRMLYCFNRSPAKDLRAINNMLRMGEKKAVQAGISPLVGTASSQHSLLLQGKAFGLAGRDDAVGGGSSAANTHTATKRIRLEEPPAGSGPSGSFVTCGDSAIISSSDSELVGSALGPRALCGSMGRLLVTCRTVLNRRLWLRLFHSCRSIAPPGCALFFLFGLFSLGAV